MSQITSNLGFTTSLKTPFTALKAKQWHFPIIPVPMIATFMFN
jgi:hypothetical protein